MNLIQKMKKDIMSLEIKWKMWLLVFAGIFTTSFLKDLATKNTGILILELICSLTFVLNVFLIAQKKYTNFVWGVLNCALYGLYAYINSYYGDFALNIFYYLPVGLYSCWGWSKKINEKNEVILKKLEFKDYFKYSIMFFLMFVFWFFLIPLIPALSKMIFTKDSISLLNWKGDYINWNDGERFVKDVNFYKYYNQTRDLYFKIQSYEFGWGSWKHIFDVTTNSLGVISTFMMKNRLWTQYICYFIYNPLNIILWLHLGSINVAISYVTGFIIAIHGYVIWKNSKKE